jgi:hypothetical protein
MNSGFKQNNSKDKPSVNTRGYAFMNREGFEPSAMTVGFWDDKMTITINPALEPSKQTNDRFYDYEKSVKTSLTLEKVMSLMYKISKEIIPAIESDTDKSIGVAVGNDGMIAVGTGKSITGSIRPFLALFKGINPDTKKAELSIYYEFRTIDSIDDYDPATGKYTLGTKVYSELLLFIEILKSTIIGMSNAGTHSDRYVNKFVNDRLYDAVVSIGEKVGANVTPRGGNRMGGFGQRTTWGSQSSNESDLEAMAEAAQLTNLDQMEEYLN